MVSLEKISYRTPKKIKSATRHPTLTHTLKYTISRGGFRGGGRGGGRSFLTVRPLPTKGSPFVLFWNIHFWWRTLKFFWRHLWRQYILILRGGRAQKKNAIPFWPVFWKFCLRRKKFGQSRTFLRELEKSICRPKKRSSKFFTNCLKIRNPPPPPLLVKILVPPWLYPSLKLFFFSRKSFSC